MVNPKSYIYGEEAFELARICDRLAGEYDIDIFYTAQAADIQMLAKATQHVIVCAQHMDSLVPGRGMGHILPESLKAAGARAVVLNHAEKSLELKELDRTIRRADALELFTIVCADTVEQCKAVAQLNPDMMICEPTGLIGTGMTSGLDYVRETNRAVREISKDILLLQAAGVSKAADVYKLLREGANGTGGTSGILNAENREEKIREMLIALKEAIK